MDSTNNDSLNSLTDEQIERLAVIVFEDFGPALPRVQFDDVVRLLFEDIAGFDVMSEQTATDHVRSNRSH